MSDRGSFVSQYIYDKEDFEKIKYAIFENAKQQKNNGFQRIFPLVYDVQIPIVAGSIRTTNPSMEYFEIQDILICLDFNNPIKISVFSESGKIKVMTFHNKNSYLEE